MIIRAVSAMGMSRDLTALGLVGLALGACVATPKWEPAPKEVTTKVYDEFGREVAKPVAGSPGLRVLGLGPRRELDPLASLQEKQGQGQGQGQDPQEAARQREAQIRLDFGSTVLIRGELVTKRYFMSGETGELFTKLTSLKADDPTPEPYGGKGDTKSILGDMLGEHEVSLAYIKDFEPVPPIINNLIMKGNVKQLIALPGSEAANSLLLVTAKPTALAAFESALNLFYANIPQVEIEIRVVEFSTSDSLSFGVIPTSQGTPTFNNLSSDKLISDITSNFPLSAPLGSGIKDVGVLTLGGIHDAWELSAKLQALEISGKADILSSPRLVVRNGGIAMISTSTDYPFPQAKITANVNVETNISFKPVGISLGIKPVIAGTETVILQVYADVSAVTAFVKIEPLTVPIVSTRRAITSVHVPNGKTTVIGGLITSNTFETEIKVPILGDIPLLGYLFRSTTTQTTETELIFFITPRILIGPQEAMIR